VNGWRGIERQGGGGRNGGGVGGEMRVDGTKGVGVEKYTKGRRGENMQWQGAWVVYARNGGVG
jgi:hypothetical protein